MKKYGFFLFLTVFTMVGCAQKTASEQLQDDMKKAQKDMDQAVKKMDKEAKGFLSS